MRTLLPGRWAAALEGQLFRPRSVAGIRGLPLRFLRYTWAIARELIAGQLTQRAEGLVYMTILSVVPLLAISFSLLKAFELHRQVEPLLREWLAPLAPRSEVILETVMGLVDNTRGTILASLGIVLLLYTAMSMARRVEDSLNFVWQVSHPRAFARRLRDQLAAILLGPVVMAVGMALIAWLARSAASSDLAAFAPVIPVLPVGTRAAPWLLVCAAFSFAYWYIPNTRVQPRAALAGGIVGGVTWAAAGVLVARVIVTSTQTLTLYAGFAIAISALVWIFLCWLTFLIGAQVAFYVQHPEYLRVGTGWPDPGARRSEQLALAVMLLVARRLRWNAPPPDLNDISTQLALPGIELTPVIQRLESAGLLRVSRAGQLLLHRKPATIPLHEILTAARDPAQPEILQPGNWPAEVPALVDQLEGTVCGTLGARTLADLSGAGNGHAVDED